MEINFLAVIAASFTTLLVGFVYYHPKVFGTIWMKETGLTEEELKKGNMLKIFGLTLIFSFLIAFMMQMFTIHQTKSTLITSQPSLIHATITVNLFSTFYHQ